MIRRTPRCRAWCWTPFGPARPALSGAQAHGGDLKSLTTPQELAIGQVFAEQVEQQYPLLHDPVLTWYINLRGRELADRSPRNNLPYFFLVIDSPEINAFAIPGGHVFVNLGVFQVAGKEGERCYEAGTVTNGRGEGHTP